MNTYYKTLGNFGEELACTYLLKNKYCILEKNFQNRKGYKLGEIDIIAKRKHKIHFIEVKTRNTSQYLRHPLQNITSKKLRMMEKMGNYYISKYNLWSTPHQYDAISIVVSHDWAVETLQHIENIFL